MTEKFKILAKFIKDVSSETPNIETYLFVKENISKYQLNIDITSKALKNKLIEVNTTLKFEDKETNEKKSHYEIVYATIIKVDDEVKVSVNLRSYEDRNGELRTANCNAWKITYADGNIPKAPVQEKVETFADQEDAPF